jgi:hypothetical protein
MSLGQETAMYLAAAAPCFLVVVLLMRWARPVNGELSPRLRPPGMETLVVGVASLAGIVGIGLTIGAILRALE